MWLYEYLGLFCVVKLHLLIVILGQMLRFGNKSPVDDTYYLYSDGCIVASVVVNWGSGGLSSFLSSNCWGGTFSKVMNSPVSIVSFSLPCNLMFYKGNVS